MDELQRLLDLAGVPKTLFEKWGEETEPAEKDKGKWDGWTVADLKKRRSKLKSKEQRTDTEIKELKQINFAIRAKTGWGKVS